MSILENFEPKHFRGEYIGYHERDVNKLLAYARLLEDQNGELLEALKAIEHIGDNDPDCNHCGEYLDAREIARKAIAKAEGRE